MGQVIIGFNVSLDGFIYGQNWRVERLYPHLGTLRYAKPLQELIEKTGAVVVARKTFGSFTLQRCGTMPLIQPVV